MQFVQFAINHFDQLVQLVILLVSLLLATGWLKNQRLRQALEDAVGYAEQWKKQQTLIDGQPPSSDRVKAIAIDYATKLLPDIDSSTLGKQIEATLGVINAAKVKPVERLRDASGKFIAKQE